MMDHLYLNGGPILSTSSWMDAAPPSYSVNDQSILLERVSTAIWREPSGISVAQWEADGGADLERASKKK